MIFLPFERIVYRTKLSEEEVIRRLANVVEPVKIVLFSFSWPNRTKPYEGEITGNTFAVSRVIRYRNSFLPRITGTIQSDSQETTIAVTMQLHPFTIIFLLIWISFVAPFGLVGLRSLLSGYQPDSMSLLPLGMIVFLYAITMAGFKFESNRSKKDLRELFEGEMIT